MVIGLLPTTGLTLPFVSYGRSNLVLSMLLTGILVNIGSTRERVYNDGATDLAIGSYGAERCGDHVTGDYRFVEVDSGHWLPDTHPDLLASEILDRVRSFPA